MSRDALQNWARTFREKIGCVRVALGAPLLNRETIEVLHGVRAAGRSATGLIEKRSLLGNSTDPDRIIKDKNSAFGDISRNTVSEEY